MLARTYPEVRVVHHAANRGYGAALRSGFAAATRDLVFYTDGDAQYDPSEMALLWQALRSDVDLVNGYKISRSDPLHRIAIGRIYHHTVKLMFGLKIRDVDCDFRLIRRTVFDRIVTAIGRVDLWKSGKAVESLRVTLNESHVASASYEGRL